MSRRWNLVVVVTLVAASCGGEGGGAEDTTSVAPSTTAATTTTTIPAGFEWERIEDLDAAFGGPDTQAMHGVAFSGESFFGVGRDGDKAAIWMSEDGLTWRRVPHDEALFGGEIGSQQMWAATDGPQGVTIVGDDFAFGAAWLIVGTSILRVPGGSDSAFGGSSNQTVRAVAAAEPGLVAVGDSSSGPIGQSNRDAVVWVSSDGLVWYRVPHSEQVFGGSQSMLPTDEYIRGVAAGGPGVVAVGSSGMLSATDAVVWTSSDGTTWSRVPHDEDVFGGAEMLDVVAGGPGLVAVGRADGIAAVWTSEDGREWTKVSGEGAGFGRAERSTIYAVTTGGPGLVAIGGDATSGPSYEPVVWTSVDGITWERVPDLGFPSGDYMSDVIGGGPGLIAVGYANAGDDKWDAAVWVSPPPGD